MLSQKLSFLHSLVNQVVVDILPLAAKRRSLIINDVQRDLVVNVDEQQLAILLKDLLCDTISNTENDCIRIMAKSFTSLVLMHVRTNDFRCEEAIANNLKQFDGIAEKLGGCLSVTKNKLYGGSISFTFVNL